MATFNRFQVLNIDDQNSGSETGESEHIDDFQWREQSKKTHLYQKKKFMRKENKNIKKILCHNMITLGSCCYGNKCLYAHNLTEQSIDSNRKDAYEILLSSEEIHVDLRKNHSLYRSLMGLTKMCEKCEKNTCTGGYNCKFGACSKKYCVCIQDLDYGNCAGKCGCVHLTDRGLKPFYFQQQKPQSQLTGTLLSSEFFKRINNSTDTDTDSDNLSDISDDASVKSNVSDLECHKSIFE